MRIVAYIPNTTVDIGTYGDDFVPLVRSLIEA